MIQDLNVFSGTGRLAKEPELHENGDATHCRLRLASNRIVGSGENRQQRVSYIDITVWGNQGRHCNQYLKTGSQISIEGRLEERRFETKSGQPASRLVIVARTVNFLDQAPTKGRAEQPQQAASVPVPTPQPAAIEPQGAAPTNFGKRRGGTFKEEMPF